MADVLLSDELKSFAKMLRKLPAAEAAKVYAAMKGAIGPVKSSRVAGGKTYEVRDVDWQPILDAMPPDLRQDARQLQRYVAEDVKKFGSQWGQESEHLLVTNWLLPQPTAAELAATPELVAAVVKQLPSMQAPSIDIEKLAEMVATKLQDRANAKLQAQNPPAE